MASNNTMRVSPFFSGRAESFPLTLGQGLLVLFLGYVAVHQYRYWQRTPKVLGVGFPPIPILGPWIATFRFLRDPVGLVRDGLAKSKNGLIRIATVQAEYVLVSDRQKVSEYLRAPDTVLNAQEGANDQQQIPFTMGYGVGHRTYHTAVVRGPVTQSIPGWTPDFLDEAQLALDELVRVGNDYEAIPLYEIVATTVARMANRVYVGTEFCRNEEYLRNATDYAQAIVLTAELIRPFPDWLKHVLIRIMPVWRHRKKAEVFLRTYIEDRLNGKLDENGNKPTDLVQRLIDAAPPIEKTVPQLAERVMALNVASIHTTTMTLTGGLYQLAQQPEKYADVLRKEVLDNLEGGQITNTTLANLPMMESFLRETGRFTNAGLMTMQRNARQDFKFSDGTVIPAGAKIGAIGLALQRDAEVYQNPDEFDGFRFYQGKGGSETKPLTILNTGPNFHLFGHGRHPCPGRFIATHEMKILFSLLLLRYDWKLAAGTKPQPFFIATMCIPDINLKVLFRKRGPNDGHVGM
ncbi:cytochrome P450 [Xylariomycetidae sp. FL2044]|nr:cytochrome P450 [Xylariomycetidae sp. FL2044]